MWWYLADAVNAAVISLFIPDGQGQSLSVDNLGTDSGGHTTWAIGIAGATPTVLSEAPGIGKFTLAFLAIASGLHVTVLLLSNDGRRAN